VGRLQETLCTDPATHAAPQHSPAQRFVHIRHSGASHPTILHVAWEEQGVERWSGVELELELVSAASQCAPHSAVHAARPRITVLHVVWEERGAAGKELVSAQQLRNSSNCSALLLHPCVHAHALLHVHCSCISARSVHALQRAGGAHCSSPHSNSV